MADRRTGFRGSKSIAGTALAVLGTFILYEEVSAVVAGLRHVLGANGWGALGLVSAVVLSASHLQAYACVHQHLLREFIRHMLGCSKPLLLVGAVTGWSQDAIVDSFKAVRKKVAALVDFAVGRSTSK
jgi:hypothetical protein